MSFTYKKRIELLKAEVKALKAKHLAQVQQMRIDITKKAKADNAAKVREALKKGRKRVQPIIKSNVSRIKQKAKEEIKGRAVVIANKRIERHKMRYNLVYMDGVMCFPVMLSYAREIGITPWSLSFLVLINFKKEYRYGDFVQFGYQDGVIKKNLKLLYEAGFIEKFGSGNFTYTPSLKGRKAFYGFRTYYKKTVKYDLQNETGKVKRHRWPSV